MRRILLLLACLATPALAEAPTPSAPALPADLFAHLAANTWAFPDASGMRCDENPHSVRFNPERSLSWFDWRGPMTNYLGEIDQQAVYDVLESDESSITMYLQGEQRRTAAGVPVIWILRMLDGGAAYCWDRTDWDPPRCTHLHIRCQGPVPTS